MTDKINDVLRKARKMHPDLFERTELVARIIDLSAFAEGWVTDDKKSQRLMDLRLKYQQVVAMRKAHDVLTFLGVNTRVDWRKLLERC